jgi:hypothetical protein
MLTLLGTIVGKSQSSAVLLDQTSNGVIRLRTGQAHAGWVLRSVGHRVVILGRERQEFTLALPATGTKQTADVALGLRRWPDGWTFARKLHEIRAACRSCCANEANSRKKRWHDALEAAMARRGR